jgi:DNA integrity scanning protein DisA with diadenylate cyclase activity
MKVEIKLRVSYKAVNVAPSREITVLSRKTLKYGVLIVIERRTRISPLINNVQNRNIFSLFITVILKGTFF